MRLWCVRFGRGVSIIGQKRPASVRCQVAHKDVVLSKIRGTKVALERSLASVDADVLDQVACLLEGLVAVAALVRALARMYPLVTLHVLLVRCGVATHETTLEMQSLVRVRRMWLAITMHSSQLCISKVATLSVKD